jgi:zinc ribbon protein
MKCPVCSAELPATARFCGSCGTTLTPAPQSPQPSPPKPTPPPPAPPPAPMQHAEPRPVMSPPPSYGAPAPPPSIEKKYRMLRLAAMMMKIAAFVVGGLLVIIGLITMILGITGGSQPSTTFGGSGLGQGAGAASLMTGFVGGLLLIVNGFIVFIGLYAYSEVLHVMMDLEENTRRTNEMLARR